MRAGQLANAEGSQIASITAKKTNIMSVFISLHISAFFISAGGIPSDFIYVIPAGHCSEDEAYNAALKNMTKHVHILNANFRKGF